jgi:hypothetical protein
MRSIKVVKVSLDSRGSPVVTPSISPEEDFEFLWRAAMSTRWLPEERAVGVAPDSRLSPEVAMRCIVKSLAGEYGCRLELTDATEWVQVPQSVRSLLRQAILDVV